MLIVFLGYFSGITSVIEDDRKSKENRCVYEKTKENAFFVCTNVSNLRDHTSSTTTIRELQTSGRSSAETHSTLSSLSLAEGAVFVLSLPERTDLIVAEIIVMIGLEAKISTFLRSHSETSLLKVALLDGQSCHGGGCEDRS